MQPVTDPDILAQLNAPQRAEVPSTRRVWGDREAEAAGLYEQSRRPVTDPALLQQLNSPAPLKITVNPVASRFGEMQPPQDDGDRLQDGLNRQTLDMTRKPQLSPTAQMAGDMANLVPAASQGTTPRIDQYGGQIVSTDVFEDDGGNVQYRDPQTGEIKPTDNTKHVALRDPSDGVVKIFNRTEATNENPAVGVARVLAPGLAAGAPTARAGLPSVAPKASDILATAKEPYRAFRDVASRIETPEETAAGIVERIHNAMGKTVPRHLADEVYKSVEVINQPGKALDHIRDVKELIGQSFRSPDGRVRQAAAIANREITKIIGEVSPEAAGSLKKADAIYSTAKSVQEIQRKSKIAGLRTGRAGYGGNATNNMRQVLSPIVQKAVDGRVTGFQPGEIAAMRAIVEGTPATNALRAVGAMAPSKGIMQIALGGATAGITAAVGAAANKLAAVLTGKQIERLNELVAKRSPAYREAVANAVSKYEKAQGAFINDPSPNRFAAYLSASRALSSGLTRDGIEVTSGTLLKAIQGPVKSAAEGEEPAVPRRPGE